MKRLLTAIATAAMAISSYAVWHYDVSIVDDAQCEWIVDYEDTRLEATISGGANYGTELVIPEKLTIPDVGECTVVDIDPSAFDASTDPDARYIKTVVIPDCVTKIYEDSFSGCTSLKSVTVGFRVKYIGSGAFAGCTSLTNVVFEGDVSEFDQGPYSVFAGTPYLSRVNANDNFANAQTLSGVSGHVEANNYIATNEPGDNEYLGEKGTLWWKWTAPAGVTDVAFHTYGSCRGNTLIVYEGETLEDIREVDSDGEGRIEDDWIPFVSVSVIPGETYYICVGYNEISSYGGYIRLSWLASNGFSLFIENGLLLGCLGNDHFPETLTIPNTVNYIMRNALSSEYNYGVDKLKNLIIPGSVVTINDGAFKGCRNLANITFSEGLGGIYDYAFAGCTALKGKTITLPSTVTWVESWAFADIGGALKVKAPAPPNDNAVGYGYLSSGSYGESDATATTLTAEYFDVPDNGETYVRLGLFREGSFCWPTFVYGWEYGEEGVEYDSSIGYYLDFTVRTGMKDMNCAPYFKPMSSSFIFGGFWTWGGTAQVWDHNMKYVGGTKYWSEDGKWIYTGEDLDLIALWVSPSTTFSLSFHANGGTGGKTFASAGAGRNLGYYMNQLAPKRDGYVFNGWWTAKTGGTKVEADDIVIKNVTYYAHWKVQSFSVFFHANGGTGGKTFTIASGATLGDWMAKVSPKRDGCTFNGWWTAKTGGTQLKATDTVKADATYYAHWIVPTCSIFFHANGGTGGKTFSSVAVGAKLGTYMDKVSPKRDGFDFNGWWTEKKGGAGTQVTATTAATGDATYYAHWKAQTCSLFFHANGGTGGKTFTVPKGAKVSDYTGKVNPVNGTKTFNGWWTAKTGGTKVSTTATVTGDVTYYAHWK